MCGRVRLSSDVSEIKLVFSIPPHRPTPNIAASWNVAPTDPVPIVRYDVKASERSLDVMRWVKIAADTELDSAVEQVRTLVRADPRVLGDPVPNVLLDRRAVDALEIVAAFSTADDVAALVKSDLIKAVHTALDTHAGKQGIQPA